MVEFVVGTMLADRVRKVAAGANLRCAVAFWGTGAADLVRASGHRYPTEARIICDVSMGGTFAPELRRLGAPCNPNLRHIVGLHAKVYLSDAGIVVGSANASANGLGFDRAAPAHIEAGTFHEPQGEIWKVAAQWFEDIWDRARQVGHPELKRASKRFTAVAEAGWLCRPGSLLDLVRVDPARFTDIGFVFTSEASADRTVKRAKAAAAKAFPEHCELIVGWDREDMFTGWGRVDVLRWPTSFIEFWMPHDRLMVIPRVKHFHTLPAGDIFSKPARWAVPGLPSRAAAARADSAVAAAIIERHGNRLFNVDELVQELMEVGD